MKSPLDTELFVQNIKKICLAKGVKPTVACRESGAGPNLVSQLIHGTVPSVERVQLLAQYLGVTVSQLLGEDASELSAQPYLVMRYNQLSQAGQEDVMTFLEYKVLQEKNAKKEDE